MELLGKQIVYVLINEAMPGLVKIGKTTNLEQRIRSLDTTGIPLPFECFYAAYVTNADFVERQLHDAFDDHRIRKNREFFEIAPERIVAAVKLAELKEVTPHQDFVETSDDQAALDKAREKNSAFNFSIVGIKPGAVLTFTKDPSYTCVVVDNKKVDFENQIVSLTMAAKMILERMGYNWKQVQGPRYWEHAGENLTELRQRLEQQD